MSLDPILIREKLFKGIDSDYNVVDMEIVSEVITELENFNITKEALEATRLGKHINELRRKSKDKFLANRAKSLVKKWRSLLSESGPPPGGGENNNSVAATNGNTLANITSAVEASAIRNNLSPGLRTNLSPGLRNNLSPGLRASHQQQVRNNLRTNNLSPALRNNHAVVVRQTGSIPNSLSGGIRSARGSPSLSITTSRLSPATVTLSSGESSPAGSRPTSPAHPAFVPINPPVNSLPNSRSPSPDIEIVEEIVKAPPTPSIKKPPLPATPIGGGAPPNGNKKRARGSDENDVSIYNVEKESKRVRLDFAPGAGGHPPNAALQNGVLDVAEDRDGRDAASDKTLSSRKHLSNKDSDVLNAQISRAKRAGKVKTTQELIQNLGIDSSGVKVVGDTEHVSTLVPDENKDQLMYRFFSSQSQITQPDENEDEVTEIENEITEIKEDEDDVIEVISRPGTAAGSAPHKSQTNSQVSSRINTPAPPQPLIKQSVEDILSQLEPIDIEAVMAEWDQKCEQEEDIPGLIPVYKPKLEVTEAVVADLNDGGELEHLGGVKDYTGGFKEWHEMVALQRSLDEGDLLHVLPYSVID